MPDRHRVDWDGVVARTEHRPWPMPRRPWVMTMSWHDLLFAHYRVPAHVLRALVPAGLELDTHDGEAWLAVVPFRMSHVGPRGLGSLPWVSAFPELNVRTYVRAEGKAGVWFFSLDAASRVAVEAARLGFHLPYLHARMRCHRDGEGWVHYESARHDRRGSGARLRGRYRPTGPVNPPGPGSLEAFLTDRFCLYAADGRGRLFRGDIHHQQWPLRTAELILDESTMALAAGVAVPEQVPLLHFADRVDVVAWNLERVGA